MSVTSTTNACLENCNSNLTCLGSMCCQAFGGGSATFGACLAPSDGDRGVCTGAISHASFSGRFVGSFNATRTSDLPPREGQVSEGATRGIMFATGTDLGVTVSLDTTCSLDAFFNSARGGVRFTQNGSCAATTVLPGARLTVISGSAVLTRDPEFSPITVMTPSSRGSGVAESSLRTRGIAVRAC